MSIDNQGEPASRARPFDGQNHGHPAADGRGVKTKIPPRAWTADEQERLKAMLRDGISMETIAETLGRTVPSIKAMSFKSGHPGPINRAGRHWTKTEDKTILAAFKNGFCPETASKLARTMNRPVEGIRDRLKRLNAQRKIPPGGLAGGPGHLRTDIYIGPRPADVPPPPGDSARKAADYLRRRGKKPVIFNTDTTNRLADTWSVGGQIITTAELMKRAREAGFVG